MKKIIQGILLFLFIILVIDFAGFVAWFLSGQTPADTGFIGNLTARFFYFLINL